MQCIFQRNWHSSVRLEEEILLSEVTYCGSEAEVCARIKVHPQTFAVLDATWERYRTPQEAGYKKFILPQLAGMEAYFGCGKTLREALAFLQDSYAEGLFAEAVRGIIQAETFLLMERGFSSPQAYEEYWNKLYVNACRFYSNLDRVTRGWYEHVGYHTRRGSLFNRMKSQALYDNGDSYLLTGNFNDSFHAVAIELVMEKSTAIIKQASGDILRAPDPVCAEAVVFLKVLEGKNLINAAKKEIVGLLGGGNGCVHLIDLVHDGMETLTMQ